MRHAPRQHSEVEFGLRGRELPFAVSAIEGVVYRLRRQRRKLSSLVDHASGPGAFVTKWEGWKNPNLRTLANARGRINVTAAEDIDRIDDAMGVYAVLYEPSARSRYVVYIGYSKVMSTELSIRYGKWAAEGRFNGRVSSFPFAAFYVSSQREARDYEDDLIRYYAPPWNTKFHR